MIKIFQTTKDYNFLEIAYDVINNELFDIEIDDSIKYQTIDGFGGAITESSAYIYSLLSNEDKETFLKAYFSEEGLNYNLGRLTIGSCDFSLGQYDYLVDDKFSLEHEKQYLFPLLLDISKYKNLSFMVSSWSPLAKRKNNNSKLKGGHLLKECYKDYVSYIVTYIKEMKKLGFNIDMMTIQNEPQAVQTWESCIFSEKEEANLAVLINEKLIKNNMKIDMYIWDHNRDIIVKRVKKTLSYLNDSSFITGIAYHWYDNGCNKELSKVHEMYPDKKLIFSEGCIELLIFKDSVFDHALRYGIEYLNDINNYSNGFIDWNILLDEKGGPNHVGNYCESLIQYDTKNHKLIFNKSYYFVKHFSHFITKDSIRIENINKSDVMVCSLKNINNEIVVILINKSKQKNVKIKIKEKIYSVELKEDSISTIVYKE